MPFSTMNVITCPIKYTYPSSDHKKPKKLQQKLGKELKSNKPFTPALPKQKADVYVIKIQIIRLI
jgi:hypothetical protein